MDDRIIGLEFPNGSVWYCPRSTLVLAGGFFAACYGSGGVPTRAVSTDERGRSIYFIARDGELFGKHILPYILKKRPGKLPPFSEDPELWRELREEAVFYAMDDLSDMLQVTHTCDYSIGDDRGVLYWLGTDRGNHEYQNPHANGAVGIHVGRLGDMTLDERNERLLVNVIFPQAYTQESRQALVQYRPPIIGKEEGSTTYHLSSLEPCYSLWCGMGKHRIPTIIDLREIKLRLTAYSLRNDRCGMTDWNLEASEDGTEWTVLHEARNDPHIAMPADELLDKWVADMGRCQSDGLKLKISQEFAERELRHTWQIYPSSPTFFRYFRIIGPGPDYEHGEGASTCLHGVGLELYGDIHED